MGMWTVPTPARTCVLGKPWAVLLCFKHSLSLLETWNIPSSELCLPKPGEKGWEAIWAPKAVPWLIHHLSLFPRFVTGGRSSSGVPSIDAEPWRCLRDPRAGWDPTWFLPDMGSSPDSLCRSLSGPASSWADPCLGQTLVFCSFLCLNYLNIPHLYFMCLAPLLFLCVQIISPSGKKRNKLFFHWACVHPMLPFYWICCFFFTF